MSRAPHQPSLRMADGGGFFTRLLAGTKTGQAVSNRAATIDAAVASPAPAPAQPRPAVRERTVADIKFKDGGTLRTGMGGHVPGTGAGDKIDAKYEPGEFVASNDMLDAEPGLREHLSSLRSQVLAAKGVTQAQADAKAVRGGSLRALDGFEVTERPWAGAADARTFAQQPGPGNPVVGAGGSPQAQAFRAAQGYDAGSTGGPHEVQAGQRPVVEGRPGGVHPSGGSQGVAGDVAGNKGLWGRVKDGASSTLRGAKNIASGDFLGADVGSSIKSAGTTLRGALTSNLGAGVAAGAGIGGAIQGFNTPTEEYRARMGMSKVGTPGEDMLARTVGVLADVGDNATFGLASKLGKYLDGGETAAPAAPQPSAAPGVTRNPGNPFDAANKAKLDAYAATPSLRDPGAVRRINGGSSPLFTNMPDEGMGGNDSLMGRGKVSAQNMAAADALDGRYASERAGARANEQFAKEVAQAQAVNANTLRGAQQGVLAHKTQRQMDRTRQMDIDEAAGIRTTDTTLRGQDLTLQGHRMSNQIAQRSAQRDQFNKDREFGLQSENHRQALLEKSAEDTRKEFATFNEDGTANPGLSARRFDTARQVFPGIEHADKEVRNRAMADAKEMLAIFDKAQSQDKVGWDALKFWEPQRPALRGMPDARGGSTEQLSGPFGGFTLGAQNGDTLLTKGGHTVNLGKLNAKQLELLDRAKSTGWGK